MLNRQVRSFPSAVRRIREQWPQKGCVTGAIRPISPGPSTNLIFARGLAAFVLDFDERPARVNAAIDFRGGNHCVASPGAVGIERHEFDEAHDQVAFARKYSEGFHFVVIQAAHQYGVHFYGTQARTLRGVNTGHHCVECFGARHALEFFAVERIKADVDAVKARGEQRVEALGQQVAIGRDRKIARRRSLSAAR